jgi:putative transcriptional regulator
MTVIHHPDDSTLISYAAGTLPESFSVLVSCHLSFCQTCKDRIKDAETLGAAMMLDEPGADVSVSRDAFFERLMTEPDIEPIDESSTDPSLTTHHLPKPLAMMLEQGEEGLPWRRLVPGIQQIKMDTHDGELRLLKIQPGVSIPIHTHHGSEMTLILKGSYSDELGRFKAGDVADLDPTIEHQPITDGAEPCICLIATDAPMKFQGLLPKLLQPFVGL